MKAFKFNGPGYRFTFTVPEAREISTTSKPRFWKDGDPYEVPLTKEDKEIVAKFADNISSAVETLVGPAEVLDGYLIFELPQIAPKGKSYFLFRLEDAERWLEGKPLITSQISRIFPVREGEEK